jgi:geranylgeranylglycerol-phosphate geranylgeranyltransferase
MASVAVFIGAFLVVKFGFTYELTYNIIFAMVAGFVISGAGNTINDYVDVEADKINRPNRPIPSGEMQRKTALIYSIILFAAGIILAAFINWMTFLIAVLNSVLLVLYSLKLQNKIFLGNGSVSYLVGSSFLFGGAAMGNIALPFMLFTLSFLTNFSREIVKDIEDLEGDRWEFLTRVKDKLKESVEHVAERFGIKRGRIVLRYNKNFAKDIAALMLILAVVFSPLPYFLGLLSKVYLIILIPTDIAFLFAGYQTLKAHKTKDFRKISRNIKTGMLLGLVAFILGVVF